VDPAGEDIVGVVPSTAGMEVEDLSTAITQAPSSARTQGERKAKLAPRRGRSKHRGAP
jgi:hypothetical protein